MKALLEQYGITGILGEVLASVAILALVFAANLVIAIIVGRLKRRLAGTHQFAIIRAIAGPLQVVVLVVGFYIVANNLVTAETVKKFLGAKTAEYAPKVFYAILVLSLAQLITRLVRGSVEARIERLKEIPDKEPDQNLVSLVKSMTAVVVFFLAATIILPAFNVKIESLLGAAGIASLAVAFAAQETLANMIAGFTVLLDRPFRVGDRIKLADGTMGDVHEIGLRSTKIMTFDRTLMIIPNSDIAKTRVENLSYPTETSQLRFDIGVAYASDMDKVFAVLQDVCDAHPKIAKDPPPSFYFFDFADSALMIRISCRVPSYSDMWTVRCELNHAIKKRFEAEGIEIPFPQRGVWMRKPAEAA
jgi:MscS family membrane protein